jgi:hypothetical protein
LLGVLGLAGVGLAGLGVAVGEDDGLGVDGLVVAAPVVAAGGVVVLLAVLSFMP